MSVSVLNIDNSTASPREHTTAKSPVKGTSPIALPRPARSALPVSAHVEPYLAVVHPSTTAIARSVLEAVKLEEQARAKQSRKCGGDVQQQGPVCPLPSLRTPDLAIQAGDAELEETLERACG